MERERKEKLEKERIEKERKEEEERKKKEMEEQQKKEQVRRFYETRNAVIKNIFTVDALRTLEFCPVNLWWFT